MATIKLGHQIFDNFSGGYACEQAYVSQEKVSFIGESKNIEIYSSSNNNGFGFKKTLGNTLYHKINGEKIRGLFSYQASKDNSVLIVHTVNNTEGKLYYVNEVGEIILLKNGLNKDAIDSAFVNFSQTLPNKRYLGIFSNGTDPLIKIELGATPVIEIIDGKDSENRDIRTNILEVFYGRVWCGVSDRVHYSKSLDPFTWATEDEDAGWFQLDGDIVAMTTYANGLIVSTTRSIYYISKDNYNNGFSSTVLSPNHAISSKGIVKHDNYAIFMANDGIYPVNVTQEDTKKVDEDISWLINDYYGMKDSYNFSDMFAVSVSCQDRNEIWFHIPVIGENRSVVFIYRFLQGRQKKLYWLPPRIQPRINCLCVFKDLILSGNDNGEILQELRGKTFNGETIVAVAEFPELDFNATYNKQKFKLYLYSEVNENNRFYVDYFFDGENEYDRQEVILENISFNWDEGNWDEENWSPDVILEYQLDKPRKHNRLKLRFVADEVDQDFTIQKVVTTRVKVKNK